MFPLLFLQEKIRLSKESMIDFSFMDLLEEIGGIVQVQFKSLQIHKHPILNQIIMFDENNGRNTFSNMNI